MATPRTIQQGIDDQIARLERELIELKRQRNALSPILTIPPEILCEILLHATRYPRSHWHTEDLRLVTVRLRAPGFIAVLCHISHTWREVSIGSPSLWAEIDVGVTTDARCIEHCARHARPLPISFCVNGPGPPQTTNRLQMDAASGAFGAVKQILSEARLLGRLSLRGHIDLLSDLIQSARPEKLHTLEILVQNRAHTEQAWAASGTTLASHPLFVDGTSALHTLKLFGCMLPLTSNLFLQSQNLAIFSASTHRDLSLSSLLASLRAMPRLEKIRLEFLYPIQPSKGALTPALLSRLSELHFCGEGHSLLFASTLSHLRLPATSCDISFTCVLWGDEISREIGLRLLKAVGVARELPWGTGAEIASTGTFQPHSFFALPFYEQVAVVKCLHWVRDPLENGPSTKIRVHMESKTGSHIPWKEWHPSFLTRHPEDLRQSVGWSLDDVDVCGALGDPDYGSWWQLLSKCPKIAEIRVDPQQALKALPLLYTDEGTFPFPSLERIMVDTTHKQPLGPGDNTLESILEAITEALSKRQVLAQKYGIVDGSWMLKRLTFGTGFPSPPNHDLVHTAQIQKLIRYVDWLGKQPNARLQIKSSTPTKAST